MTNANRGMNPDSPLFFTPQMSGGRLRSIHPSIHPAGLPSCPRLRTDSHGVEELAANERLDGERGKSQAALIPLAGNVLASAPADEVWPHTHHHSIPLFSSDILTAEECRPIQPRALWVSRSLSLSHTLSLFDHRVPFPSLPSPLYPIPADH